MITDKAASVIEAYPKAQEWSITIWSVEGTCCYPHVEQIEFATSMLRFLESKGGHQKGGGSPTLLRVANARKRDLSQYLQDEKQGTLGGGKQRLAPLYSTSTATNGPSANSLQQIRSSTAIGAVLKMIEMLFASKTAGESSASTASERPVFHEFNHPFVLISDASAAHAPVWKEYVLGTATGRYPVLFRGSAQHGCPFVPPVLQAAHLSANTATQPKRLVRVPRTTAAVAASGPGMLTRSKAAAAQQLQKPETHQEGTLRASNTMTQPALMMSQSIAPALAAQPVAVQPSIVAQPVAAANQGIQGATKDLDEEDDDLLMLEDDVLAGKVVRTVALVNPLITTAATATNQTALANGKPPIQQQAGKPVARPRPGYCECCQEKYAELEKHVRNIFHRQYALEDDNYRCVDELLVFMERGSVVPPWERITCLDKDVAREGVLDSSKTTKGRDVMPLSPVSNASSMVTASRRYTANKRVKQNAAIKMLNLHTSIGDAELALSGGSSPSLKRRRSERVLPSTRRY